MPDAYRLRVLLADDEPLAAERLQLLLARCEGVDLVGSASDGEATVRLAEALKPTCFCSTSPSGLDGIEVARALAKQQPPPAVVFVTAFDQFAVAAFEIAAVDYLMKPVDPVRLERAIDRARAFVVNRGQPPHPAAAAPSNRLDEFWASDISGLVRIAARDIDRVSAERDYMRLHVGRRSWLIHHSMAALEDGLDPELFIRVHRSAIVRRDFITGFYRNPSGRWIARLADGEEQPVGRLYSDAVREISRR